VHGATDEGDLETAQDLLPFNSKVTGLPFEYATTCPVRKGIRHLVPATSRGDIVAGENRVVGGRWPRFTSLP
jgi:hypothetical protein